MPLPATCMPARTEPVMATMSTPAWPTSVRPVSRSPVMTLNTPARRISAAVIISASRTVETGVVSGGFSTTALPAAMAGMNFQMAMSSG